MYFLILRVLKNAVVSKNVVDLLRVQYFTCLAFLESFWSSAGLQKNLNILLIFFFSPVSQENESKVMTLLAATREDLKTKHKGPTNHLQLFFCAFHSI